MGKTFPWRRGDGGNFCRDRAKNWAEKPAANLCKPAYACRRLLWLWCPHTVPRSHHFRMLSPGCHQPKRTAVVWVAPKHPSSSDFETSLSKTLSSWCSSWYGRKELFFHQNASWWEVTAQHFHWLIVCGCARVGALFCAAPTGIWRSAEALLGGGFFPNTSLQWTPQVPRT